MNAVARRPSEGLENDMDTSPSVSGKRDTFLEDPLIFGTPTLGMDGRCTRGDVPATALAVDMPAVQAHAQWRNPAFKPQVEALQSSVAEGVDGAIPAWIADECNGVLGRNYRRKKWKCMQIWYMKASYARFLLGEGRMFTRNATLAMRRKNCADAVGPDLEDGGWEEMR